MDSNILLYLVSGPERVFMYFQIYEPVRDEPYAYEKNNIMTNISHLRAKIEPDSAHPRYIENVWGIGHCFRRLWYCFLILPREPKRTNRNSMNILTKYK